MGSRDAELGQMGWESDEAFHRGTAARSLGFGVEEDSTGSETGCGMAEDCPGESGRLDEAQLKIDLKAARERLAQKIRFHVRICYCADPRHPCSSARIPGAGLRALPLPVPLDPRILWCCKWSTISPGGQSSTTHHDDTSPHLTETSQNSYIENNYCLCLVFNILVQNHLEFALFSDRLSQ